MKDFAKGAFNAAASIVGGTGISFFSFFALWNLDMGNGEVNNARIAMNLILASCSAGLFAMGHNRAFFSDKTENLLKKLKKSDMNGPQ